MARPKETPLAREDKFTYTKLGDRLICFPSEVIQSDEEELIKAINHAYERNNMQELTMEQHKRLHRLLQYYTIQLFH